MRLVSSMTTKEWVRNYGKDFLQKTKTNLLVCISLGKCFNKNLKGKKVLKQNFSKLVLELKEFQNNFFTSQIKQVCSKIQTYTNDLVGECIGFQSFSIEFRFFYYLPCCVIRVNRKGLRP